MSRRNGRPLHRGQAVPGGQAEESGTAVNRRNKAGLRIERHQEIGLELARIQDRLTSIATEILNAYPVNSPVHRMLTGSPSSEALGGVFRLRCELENLMLARYPDDPRATTRVYFPARQARWPAQSDHALEPAGDGSCLPGVRDLAGTHEPQGKRAS
jgi:hypothetical protein